MTVRERIKKKSRTRERIPDQWPNGSALYRVKSVDERILLGRTYREGDKHKAWSYKNSKYVFLGEFNSDLEARIAVSRRIR